MSIIKSLSVGYGDMFYIKHNSDNFTIIDCNLEDDNENREDYLNEIYALSLTKGITRFISTHPDEDHIKGIEDLDDRIGIINFYCVANDAVKSNEETESFKHYCKLRDDKKKAFYVEKGCQRKWMNLSDEERGCSGINFMWPDTKNEEFKDALEQVKKGTGFNNISPIFTYSLQGGVKAMWLGDMETNFLEKIMDSVDWEEIDILFAPHHGRDSAKIPAEVLTKINPTVVIIGEAPSKNLNYYAGYNTITQNTAGTIVFDCVDDYVHIYVENESYEVSFLENLYRADVHGHYIGSFKTK